MPVGQVVAIHTARATEELCHEMLKPTLLPFRQSVSRMMKSDDPRLTAGPLSGTAGLPIAHLLLPAIQAASEAQMRPARTLAALQTIEALRMHAAASGGKLPAALAEVQVVPAPENPVTGEPFHYTFDAASGAATLEVPALGNSRDGKRYVIRVR
jgi:hypothetical protein